jgi:hypothetical protein
VTLAEWIDEYRRVDPDDFVRPQADPVDDWEEPPLLVDDSATDRPAGADRPSVSAAPARR